MRIDITLIVFVAVLFLIFVFLLWFGGGFDIPASTDDHVITDELS